MTTPSLARRLRERLYPYRQGLRWLRPLSWWQVHAPLPVREATRQQVVRWVYALTRDEGDEGVWTFPGTRLRLLLDLSEFIQYSIYYGGIFQPDVFAQFRRYSRPDRLFIDVGAHVGQYALWAAEMARQHSTTARPPAVLAFEPDPRIAWRLRCNMYLNQLEAYVQVQQAAVSNQSGSVPFYLDTTARTGGSGLGLHPADAAFWQGGSAVQVRCTTLDSLLERQPPARPVGLIKLDVEGAELLALQGASQTLAAHRPVLLLEAFSGYMHTFGYDYGDLYTFLRAQRYGIYTIAPTGHLHADTSGTLPANQMHDLLCVPLEQPQP